MNINYSIIHNVVYNYINAEKGKLFIDKDGVAWTEADVSRMWMSYSKEIYDKSLSELSDKYKLSPHDISIEMIPMGISVLAIDFHRGLYRMYIRYKLHATSLLIRYPDNTVKQVNEMIYHSKIIEYISINSGEYFEILKEYNRDDNFDIYEDINKEIIYV